LPELQRIAASRPILPLELLDEAYYHGDTVLCSFGPRREYLLAYMDGLTQESRVRLRGAFGPDLIALDSVDAARYAANPGLARRLARMSDARGRTLSFPEYLTKGA